ncbi:MAG: enoyl-CoA hydratase/isomerase family protein [Candidatus Schekmanbacteria bacterium]|nr:enoyl-CoA hydratase/isomerase family protein [Candidatus Schekmanbacteria bacterium]
MAYKNLLYEIKEKTGIITINRPQVLNVLNAETVEELASLIEEIKSDPSVLTVIITGAGDRAFAAGADIKEIMALTPSSAQAYLRRGHDMLNSIEMLGKPVIAAINGFCLGGGCELALACHIRIASQNASFGLPEINLGIIPGYGGTLRLPRTVGRGKALEMILTGEIISSTEAQRISLVTRIVKQETLMSEAQMLAGTISKRGPVVYAH